MQDIQRPCQAGTTNICVDDVKSSDRDGYRLQYVEYKCRKILLSYRHEERPFHGH
jgi:hypothetical protein